MARRDKVAANDRWFFTRGSGFIGGLTAVELVLSRPESTPSCPPRRATHAEIGVRGTRRKRESSECVDFKAPVIQVTLGVIGGSIIVASRQSPCSAGEIRAFQRGLSKPDIDRCLGTDACSRRHPCVVRRSARSRQPRKR